MLMRAIKTFWFISEQVNEGGKIAAMKTQLWKFTYLSCNDFFLIGKPAARWAEKDTCLFVMRRLNLIRADLKQTS